MFILLSLSLLPGPVSSVFSLSLSLSLSPPLSLSLSLISRIGARSVPVNPSFSLSTSRTGVRCVPTSSTTFFFPRLVLGPFRSVSSLLSISLSLTPNLPTAVPCLAYRYHDGVKS
ncbi:MAG: hypothetical protein KTM48_03960 [Wolbachia endosymbiont of Pissodes strobi]|nr:hypothetical protein [Wolbachia endosymbiont of Pissodes strobi]